MNFQSRKSLLRGVIQSLNLDALLLYGTRFDSRYSKWISGAACTSSFHYFFISKTDSTFLEVSYRAQDLRNRVEESVLEFDEEPAISGALAKLLSGCKRIGVVGAAPFADLNGIPCEFIICSPTIDKMMLIKSEVEQLEIGRLAKKLGVALDELRENICPDLTEAEIGKRIRLKLLSDAEALSFKPSIVSGDRLKRETVGQATERRLAKVDTLLIDIGTCDQGFYTDCSRMYFCGESNHRSAYESLCLAQASVISKINSGMTFSTIVDLYRSELGKLKLNSNSLATRELGHFIGFALHEPPFFYDPKAPETKLENGMIFTLEPEIEVEGLKLRVEDMILIKNDEAQALTTGGNGG